MLVRGYRPWIGWLGEAALTGRTTFWGLATMRVYNNFGDSALYQSSGVNSNVFR